MSNYFDNMNTQVTRGNFGSNYGKKITDKNLIPVTDRKKENKQEALLEASQKHIEISKQAQRKQIDKIKNQREFRKVLNESYDKLKDDLFCNILHHICLEALCIDEEPMYENMENITNRINEQYNELGGFKAIKEQAKKTNNLLLERMISLCENTAKKVADRNMKESDSADGFKFELTDDEKDDFEYNKDNINIDSISNKIKDKVIKVVSDEKEANNKKTEIMDEIEDKLKEDEVDDEATEEAMEFVFNENIETTTLFEALMRECYKITLESPQDIIFESCATGEVENELDDPEYKLSELDSYDDNNLMNDDVVEDLMISESFSEQLPVNKLRELEGYLSEAVRIKSKPGNLGFHFLPDTGVSEIIRSAKQREHVAKVVLQPGFRTSIMSLIKSAKHGPDVAYINQLAKLPYRLFGKNGRAVRVLEDYTNWLNGEYKEAYLEALDNLGISLSTIPQFKQKLVPYQPIADVFTEHAKSIIESVQDGDYEKLDKNLKDTSKDVKKVAEDCGKSKKNLSSCKESIREIQKSTEELKDESKNNKLAKEACAPSTIAKSKEDLSEMLVCPECGKDPCECESEELLNEYTINSNVNSRVNRKVYNQRIDAHGSINYNKIAAAGAVAGVAGAVYGKYKLDGAKVKSLCQREVGRDGDLEKWQKKIMKRIRKARKAKDVIEVKITVKNDMNALQKGLKKNPEYKGMVANQIDWYNQVAMKAIHDREKEFNIAEDFEYDFDVDEGYLFEDYYEETDDDLIFEDDEYDDDDAEDEDIKKYLEDEDDEDLIEEGLFRKKEDYIKRAENDKGKYESYKEDAMKLIEEYKDDVMTSKAIQLNAEALVKTKKKELKILSKNPEYSDYIEEIDDYIDWLETYCIPTVKNNISNRKKEIKNGNVYESFSIDDVIEESSSFVCRSCGYVAEGEAPEYCPECGNDGDQFQVMEGFVKRYVNNMKNLPKAMKGVSKDAYKFTARNAGKILINGIKAKGDINKTHDNLLKMANTCKNVGEIEYLQKDLRTAKVALKAKISKAKNDEEKKSLQDHAKWLSTTYSKALSDKKKQLKKAVKEQADFEQDFLYGKDRAIYENKEYDDYMPRPSKMRQYCLLKKINEATSFKDLDKVKEYMNEEVKEYRTNREYVGWLKESAINAMALKHIALEENVVIESFLDSLDDVCDMLDKRLDSHDEAKQAALESMYTNFNGHNVFAPIFKANDVNSSNIEFAYKVKFLCEGLKGLTKDCDNTVDLTQAERLVQRNIDTIDTIMESLDSSSYKYKILDSGKTYLEKIANRIPDIKDAYIIESYDSEYDQNILTEAIEMTDELYDNAISDDIMYNTKNSQMDVVMAEAITKYTIMETFNTLKLTDLNNRDIEKIVRNIVK